MLFLNQLFLVGVAMLFVNLVRKDKEFSFLKNWLMTILFAEVIAFAVGVVVQAYPGYLFTSGVAYACYMFAGVVLYSLIFTAIQHKMAVKKSMPMPINK